MKKVITTLLIIGLFFAQDAFCVDYFNLGKAAFNKKDYKSANTYFVKALTANPNDATCRYYYAQTLTYLNNYTQAKKEYKYVTLLAPNTKLADYSFQSIAYLDKQLSNDSQNVSLNSNENYQSLSNDNYIKKALTTKGTLVTWNADKMPLKIYLDNSKNVSNIYVNAVKSALATWQSVSNGLFSYIIINDSKFADINISFKGMALKSENQNLGLTHYIYKDEYISHIDMEMYTLGPSYKPLKDYDVYNVALHELGHALGIAGHSDNKNDVMYASYSPTTHNSKMNLSMRDQNTIKALYSIDKNPYSTSGTSITKVLGDKNTRLNTKLNDALDYIKELPANSTGYVDAGNAYLELGNETEAINYYKKALAISPLDHGANHNLGNIYYKRNDVKNAEIYYKNLIKAEPKEIYSYVDLINLYIKNNRKDLARRYLSSLTYRNPSAKNDNTIKAILQKLN